MIEDVQFSQCQSDCISKLLIDFAIEERDNDNSSYGSAIVYSAIRTGASMLHRDQAHLLIPLLNKDCVVDTTLVTLKMIGRIFEAQPPYGYNYRDNMSKKIIESIEGCMYRLSIRDAAHIQLAIFALAAIGSDETLEVVQMVLEHDNCQKWLNNDILHRLQELHVHWSDMDPLPCDEIFTPLDMAISKLKEKRFN